jgi:hypothetical protein
MKCALDTDVMPSITQLFIYDVMFFRKRKQLLHADLESITEQADLEVII